MFGLFKRKKTTISLSDLEDNPLKEGDDVVMALRYDLGECVLIQEDGSFYYESTSTKERISWLKMIDASTERQKVKKVQDED